MTLWELCPAEEMLAPQRCLTALAHPPAAAGPHHIGLWWHRMRDGTQQEVAITWILAPADTRDAILILAQDVTAYNRPEEELRAALHDKEMLLKEIHHRVKNNLQVVAGLLDIQAETVEDPRMRASFEDSRSRIQAMDTDLSRFTLLGKP